MILTRNNQFCASSSGRTVRCFRPLDFSISTLKNFLVESPISWTDPNCSQSLTNRSVKSSMLLGFYCKREENGRVKSLHSRREVNSKEAGELHLLARFFASHIVLRVDLVRTRKAFKIPWILAWLTTLTWKTKVDC